MTQILEMIRGRERVLVSENQRALQLYKGEIQSILEPGEYQLANRQGRLALEWFDVSQPEFRSTYEKVLFDKLPDVAERHLTVFRTGSCEVAIIERDGRIYSVLGPETKLTVWKDAGPWKAENIDTAAKAEVPIALMLRLGDARKVEQITVISVWDGQAGLLYVDGVFDRVLGPGIHGFWKPGRIVQHKMIDLKRQSVDVAGQEILTRDRVTIRINIAAEYRVVDPVKAATEVKDFADALYRALQYAFRKTLGAMKLDQILENKGAIDAEAAEKVRTDMAKIGVEVSEITLKDVVLPGEMREILNKVVTAEKEAEANVIRRREETNATRSLLNTAKVMAENPVMLRLKELEALESVAGKVDRLTVHNGTAGLMNDVVRLRED
ncbi:MAG: slipin family protein [Stappiaceae bacterium]